MSAKENLDFILCEVKDGEVVFRERPYLASFSHLYNNVTPTNLHALVLKIEILNTLLEKIKENANIVDCERLSEHFKNERQTLAKFTKAHTDEQINTLPLLRS